MWFQQDKELCVRKCREATSNSCEHHLRRINRLRKQVLERLAPAQTGL